MQGLGSSHPSARLHSGVVADTSRSPSPSGPDLGIAGVEDATEIGRGGFAVVYRAFQPAFQRPVAVKVLDAGALDERTRVAFQRECGAIGRLSGHPHILTVYDAGVTASGRPYLVMPYMEGGSLDDRLERHGPLPWPDAVRIAAKVARALDVAHQAGIVHLDVKPANILMTGYGEPQLADFGIARLVDATVSRGGLSFTPSHAPPEAWSGAASTPAADIYSLGSTLYTLIAGKPAFDFGAEAGVFAFLGKVANAPVPDLRPSGVPDRVCRAIEGAMAKQPAARPASASAFAEELEQLLEAEPVSPSPGRGRRRAPLLAAAAVALALALLVSVAAARDDTKRATPSTGATPRSSSSVASTAPPPSTTVATTTAGPAAGQLVAFRDAETGFSIDYPTSWQEQRARSGDVRLAISPRQGDGEALVVRLLPIEQPATAENLPQFKAVTDGIVTGDKSARILKEQPITLNGLPGYFYMYTFKDNGTGVEGVHSHYFLFEGKRMFTLVFQASPAADFEGLAALFDQMAQSVRVERA